MFAQIEKAFGKLLPLATLFQAPTVEKLAAVLRDSGWSAPWACLVPIRTTGTKPPFFFVHPIGGNIVSFRGFAARFDAGQPIYGLQARGLDGKQAPHTRIEDMAAHYIDCIRSVQPEGPYHIGGFSAGGIVAFEMARQLERQGETVNMLALLDSSISVPSAGVAAGILQKAGHWQRTLVFNARYALRTGLGRFTARKLKNWRMRARIRAWQMSGSRGLSSDGRALNVEEAFIVAVRRYRPEAYRGTAILFRAKDALVRFPDPTLGWGTLAAGGLTIREIPGDHDTLLDEPHIGDLARDLNHCLQQIHKDSRSRPERAAALLVSSAAARTPQLNPVGQSA